MLGYRMYPCSTKTREISRDPLLWSGYVLTILGDRSCFFPVKHELLWRAQWAEKLVYLQSVKLACAFLPTCQLWVLRKLPPILQSVHRARDHTHIFTAPQVSVCPRQLHFFSSSRTLAVGSRIYFDCSVCNAHKYELQTLGMASNSRQPPLMFNCSKAPSPIYGKKQWIQSVDAVSPLDRQTQYVRCVGCH